MASGTLNRHFWLAIIRGFPDQWALADRIRHRWKRNTIHVRPVLIPHTLLEGWTILQVRQDSKRNQNRPDLRWIKL